MTRTLHERNCNATEYCYYCDHPEAVVLYPTEGFTARRPRIASTVTSATSTFIWIVIGMVLATGMVFSIVLSIFQR